MTPSDWELMPKVIELLEPVLAASQVAEREAASISEIIPLTNKLRREIERCDGAKVGTMKESLLEQIKK